MQFVVYDWSVDNHVD